MRMWNVEMHIWSNFSSAVLLVVSINCDLPSSTTAMILRQIQQQNSKFSKTSYLFDSSFVIISHLPFHYVLYLHCCLSLSSQASMPTYVRVALVVCSSVHDRRVFAASYRSCTPRPNILGVFLCISTSELYTQLNLRQSHTAVINYK